MMVSDHQWIWSNTICLAVLESPWKWMVETPTFACEEVALLIEGRGNLLDVHR